MFGPPGRTGFFDENNATFLTLEDVAQFCQAVSQDYAPAPDADYLGHLGQDSYKREPFERETEDGGFLSIDERLLTPFTQRQEIEQSAPGNSFSAGNILPTETEEKIIQALAALTDSDRKRFFAAFLARRNWTQKASVQPPAHLPVGLKERLQALANKKEEKHGSRLYFATKYHLIWTFEAENLLWDILQKYYAEELAYKDRISERAIYTLYKKQGAFTKNITRDKEHMKTALFSHIIWTEAEAPIRNILAKSIANVMIPAQLQPIPPQYYTRRDAMLIIQRPQYGCGLFETLLVQLAYSKAKGEGKAFAARTDTDAFYAHLNQCARCKKGLAELEEKLLYRQEQISWRYGQTPSPYARHRADARSIQHTRQQDLICRYRQQYQKNPCELNTFYLLIAYMQAGQLQEAKNLWDKTKNLPQNYTLRNSMFSTILEGDTL